MTLPFDKYDREHLRRLTVIQRLIDDIYDEAVKEAAAIGASVGEVDLDKAFEFADYPLTQRRIEELTSWLRSQLEATVLNGIKGEWALSNYKNNVLVQRAFGGKTEHLPDPVRRRYLSVNEKARDAFIERKTNGLSLSDRVWRYSNEFKTEMEMGIDLGIRDGKSAQQMARDLKQYLQHPDKLFRRVRDEHGILHLSKKAAEFHPGRGVYRSSYLNARRLAATETNMAYHTADHERWKKMDFVVGIEIHLSNNHTCKGRDGKPHKFEDICDQLQGRYPKDFKFTGWHPHCRCYATSVLKTDEEIAEDTKKILRGEPVDGESVNKVEEPPKGFSDWMEKNEERIAAARKNGTLPEFVRENENPPQNHGYIRQNLKNTVMQDADDKLEGTMFPRTRSLLNHLTYKEDTIAEQEATAFTKAQIENHKEVSKAIGLEQGERMSFKDADSGKSNPNYSWFDFYMNHKSKYNINCTMAVATHELRMRGWDVTTLAMNTKNELMNNMLHWKFNSVWIDAKTKKAPKPQWVQARTLDKTALKFEKATYKVGRYHIAVTWKGDDSDGHVFCVDRLPDGSMRVYDPQNNSLNNMDWMKDINLKKGIKYLKVDELLINPSAVKQIVRQR